MKFRRAAPATLIVGVVIAVCGMTVIANRLFAGLTHNVEEDQFALMRSSMTASLREEESRPVMSAEVVASLASVRAAFAARDRTRLQAELQETYRALHERHGINQLAFHTPPSTVFLRVHNPRSFGDDLARLRPMVGEVNAQHVSRAGLALSISTGPGFFGVVPVRDAE